MTPPTFTAGADLLAEATETDASVAIPELTVATGVTDSRRRCIWYLDANERSLYDGRLNQPAIRYSDTNGGIGGDNAGRR